MDQINLLVSDNAEAGGKWQDPEFPPTEKSLGSKTASRVQVQWRTPSQISRSAKMFDTVEPADARQGALGDCWLISSLAAVAEFPGVVAWMFETKEINAEGKYTMRIYEPDDKEWKMITVDENLPCNPNKGPAFAQSVAGEMWVPLIEKAYAKYVGSYDKLSGGWPALALEAMTGSKSELYNFKDGKATGLNFGKLTVKKASCLEGGASIFSNGTSMSFADFWPKLKEFDASNFLMTLASPGKDVYSEDQGPKDDFGIVGGHAYTLVGVKEVGNFRLCNIRNPWGDFEWGGEWSDRSPLWDQHPDVLQATGHKRDKDDGLFWMPYDVMVTTFTSVTVNYMNKELAGKVGPPTLTKDGQPEWIEQLADLGPMLKSLGDATGIHLEILADPNATNEQKAKALCGCCSVM